MKALAITLAALALCAPVSGGTPPPDYGFNFKTVGDTGNAPYEGGPVYLDSPRAGRGSVNYEYRMAESEVLTGQWLEFINAVDATDPAFAKANLEPISIAWGALFRSQNQPGSRWVLDPAIQNAERMQVGGITWRAAAMFCNWLHNDKAQGLSAIQSGAYDTSTFGQTDPSNPFSPFTDQLTRSAGARYWIPSLDEWMKAAHYDPNKNGADEGGWWDYPYQSDSPPVSGLPGEPGAQTGADLDVLFFDMVLEYPDARSHYGLLNVSGGVSEMIEEPVGNLQAFPLGRSVEGSYTGDGEGAAEYYDIIWQARAGWEPGHRVFSVGTRIAAAVPTPSMAWIPPVLYFCFLTRRSRS